LIIRGIADVSILFDFKQGAKGIKGRFELLARNGLAQTLDQGRLGLSTLARIERFRILSIGRYDVRNTILRQLGQGHGDIQAELRTRANLVCREHFRLPSSLHSGPSLTFRDDSSSFSLEPEIILPLI
jgi:hypothetical protein